MANSLLMLYLYVLSLTYSLRFYETAAFSSAPLDLSRWLSDDEHRFRTAYFFAVSQSVGLTIRLIMTCLLH